MLRGAPATSVHRRLICTSTIIWALLAVGGYKRAFADTPSMVRGIYGDVGLINTPSARMAPDGEFYISADFFKNTQHYDTGFQILPWLEGSFRYSGLQHFEAGLPVYFDRSFALKARLWDETDIAPALAVGINDLVGTGIYSGEYVVATKQVGPLDFSIGLGWGRLANNSSFRNPLGALSSSFYTRAAPATYGGQFSFGSYFHGQDTGVFGGVSWQTPIKNLTLIGEYSSDTYAAERQSGNFNAHSQFNFGANYRITDSISLGVDWLYGDSLAGTVTVALDPVHPQFPTSLAPPLPRWNYERRRNSRQP